MKTINNIQAINVPTKFHSLMYNELSLMTQREVYLIWEMIQVMKQTHNIPQPQTQKRARFNFERSQMLLNNIKGSLSDDIIYIEREDKV